MGIVDNISLYLITDDLRSKDRPVDEIVTAACAGGVKMMQYRPWEITDHDYTYNGLKLRSITRKTGTFLLVNSRPTIALKVGADGCHLNRKSPAVPAARRRMYDQGIFGYSAHSLEEAIKAEESGAHFVTFSPVFETTSSSDKRATVGIDAVVEVTQKLSIPVFPLGGIGLEQIKELRAAGIKRAAVVSAITEADDVEKATREIIEALEA